MPCDFGLALVLEVSLNNKSGDIFRCSVCASCDSRYNAYMMTTTYAIADRTSMLSDSLLEKKYVLKVRDLPLEDKPREKMLAQGPGGLSVVELLAIVLSVGTKKEEVLAMSSRILKEYGTKSLVSARDPKKLVAELGIPEGKALQIVACAELGRRFFDRNIAGAAIVRSPRDVFEYAKDMRDLSREHLRGIYLNAHYKVIHDEVISIGTVDASIIHPREVFKPALEYSAAAVILVHNHPSGIAAPSAQDIAVTKQLAEAGRMLGIDLIDHVVVTRDEFASIPLE